ncbi:MAG: nuclear transport factor 2 family protein [Anaerolineaceae bacterium]|nr:nuclear transport factor 2 family protein [Anaerolineaceae bacterium]
MGLQGKGFFIWKIPDCEGGNPSTIADVAKAAGLSHVLIKIADGPYIYNYDWKKNVDLALPVVIALHKKGIQAWGWHYVYGYDPLGEAKKAAQRCISLNLDGYVIDAEGEYKLPGRDKVARTFMTEFRRNLSSLPVALCSYRYPSYHPQLPWSVFLEKSNYNMPQVYWEQGHNSGDQLRRSYKEFQTLSPVRPYLATGPTYYSDGWMPTVSEIQDFLYTAKLLKIPAVNFFSWDYCRRSMRPVWDTIADFDWSSPQIPVKDIPELMILAMNTKDGTIASSLYSSDAVLITAAKTIQGLEAIRLYYIDLFTKVLPNASFRLTGSTGSGNSRHFTWEATSTAGKVLNGNDTIGLIDGKITYHYRSFTVTR